jgi:hypothetical protein
MLEEYKDNNYVVVSVKNIKARDEMVKNIYDRLSLDRSLSLVVIKDQVNRVRVYHRTANSRILIRTYLVVVLPIMVDLSQLDHLYGTVYYNLDETIDQLRGHISKLESLNKRKVKKGNSNEQQTLGQLVRSLSTPNGEH